MEAVIFFIISLPFFGLGYLIWQKGIIGLLAGFDEKTFKGDKRKVAKAGGQTAYTIAAGLMICSILSLFISGYAILPLAAIIVLVIFWMNIRLKQIEKEGKK